MEQYKIDFIHFLVKANALKFGEFKLKSGRMAPYFVNAGNFYTGEMIHQLARFYAQAFINLNLDVDIIFGPAYKGIPLAVTTSSVLSSEFHKNISYCFNRKEVKDYGDKSLFVGAPLTSESRVLLIDDVITAGTAVRITMEMLQANGNPKVQGLLISLNRMEKNNEGENALEKLEKDFGFKVFSIVNLDEVIEVLYNKPFGGTVYIDDEKMEKIRAYRKIYGV